jgi:hypothetical protein
MQNQHERVSCVRNIKRFDDKMYLTTKRSLIAADLPDEASIQKYLTLWKLLFISFIPCRLKEAIFEKGRKFAQQILENLLNKLLLNN